MEDGNLFEENQNPDQSDNLNPSSNELPANESIDFGGFLDFGSGLTDSLPDLTSFISSLNTFTLAWCIFYSIFFMADFFFWYVLFTEGGELPRERRGMYSMKTAVRMWATYFVCLLFFWIYLAFPGFRFFTGILTILVYFSKLILGDFLRILSIINFLRNYTLTFLGSIFVQVSSPAMAMAPRLALNLEAHLGIFGFFIDSISVFFSGNKKN